MDNKGSIDLDGTHMIRVQGKLLVVVQAKREWELLAESDAIAREWGKALAKVTGSPLQMQADASAGEGTDDKLTGWFTKEPKAGVVRGKPR